MAEYVLSFKPAISAFGVHDPSAALFTDGELTFAVEEERYTRSKHAVNTFPENAIQGCLDAEGLELPEVDRIVLPYQPELNNKIWRHRLERVSANSNSPVQKILELEEQVKGIVARRFFPDYFLGSIRERLREFGTPIPEIELKSHHRCHAASAFYPTNYEKALVLTVDGRGEYDSTVVWQGDQTGLERYRTFEVPNSLGHFYGAITEFLGYRRFNGEGKVMGLAPYGGPNEDIETALKDVVDTSADYDVTGITQYGIDSAVQRLESLFGRSSKDAPVDFTSWEKDLAYVTQAILEEVMLNLVRRYTRAFDTKTVCLAGGVALNCKMNKVVEQSEFVDELFVQPVAHDAGLALGGGMLTSSPWETPAMNHVYWGPEYDDAIEAVLAETKLDYEKVPDVPAETAKHLADGDLVGWFQGRVELGPRALGNRSILADPRTAESRDRVNEYVKHREGWRPFAPSMKADALEEYLVDASPSPFMIKTYEVREDKRDEIPAVLHPGDGTTRPQTVNEAQNPRYYALLSEFEKRTGVPVVLNTSFNDHAEPIVTRPAEALKDFYGMGLDVLVLGDYLLKK